MDGKEILLMEGSSENQVKNTILSWPLEGKKILWFSKFNQYLIAASPADQIIERISQGDNSASVQAFCQSDLQMDQDQAKTFEIEIKQFIKNCIEIEPKISGKKVSLNKNQRAKQKSLYEKFYQIFGIIFFVDLLVQSVGHFWRHHGNIPLSWGLVVLNYSTLN